MTTPPSKTPPKQIALPRNDPRWTVGEENLYDSLMQQIETLKEERSELLRALREIVPFLPTLDGPARFTDHARAAATIFAVLKKYGRRSE